MAASPRAFRLDVGGDSYDVSIDIFEGPLDLLLFLIRKDEIDIYDIPIADITRHFLEYVEFMQSLDLEQAGDFVVMAATLMKIKSRMLLPSSPDEEEQEEDPREELVRRLLEYQQFKEVSFWLEERQAACHDNFYRGSSIDLREITNLPDDWTEALRPVGLFDLLTAFKQAVDAAPKSEYHEVQRAEVTVEERAEAVLEMLARRGQAPFRELVSGASRIVLVVTFVAMLELIRIGEITVRQAGPEGEIWVYRREPEAVGGGPERGAAETQRDA